MPKEYIIIWIILLVVVSNNTVNFCIKLVNIKFSASKENEWRNPEGLPYIFVLR